MIKQSYKWMFCMAFSYLTLGCCDEKQEHILSEVQGELYGQFANGMKYYIKENPYDTKKASLRLAVKVGSIFEEEDERGLAHFLEHMVFRGTKSYSDGEVVGYLESIGASFGADTNAYTSYDETVYVFEIPLDKKESLKKAFSILSEFAMQAKLSSEQLEIEKGVVLDELRLRESISSNRIGAKLTEIFLQDTLYAKRNPIGLEEVIKGCTEEKIQNFYSKWYRPENMAIIAVGDFSSEEVMSYVSEYFEILPMSEFKAEYVKPAIPSLKHSTATVYRDPETLASYFVVGSWVGNRIIRTKEDYKQEVIDQFVLSMMNRRLERRAESSEPPFKGAEMNFMQIIHPAKLFLSGCVCWDEDPLKGLDALGVEIQRLRNQEFGKQEFEIAISNYRGVLKEALENQDKHKNAEYVDYYVQHFMYGGALFSFEESAKIGLEIADQIDLKEINERRLQFFNQEPSIIYFPSEKGPDIEESLMLSLLSNREIETSTSESEESKILSLQTSLEEGTIVESKVFGKTRIKKLMLSNGMKVYLHPSNLKENIFSFTLKASNGLNSCDLSLFPSAKYSCSYLGKSGLAGLSSVELKDALAGKNVGIEYDIEINSRNIKGQSSNEDMQVAFKLIHALFTDRVYREDAWNQQMKSLDDLFDLQELNPDVRFMHFINSFNRSNHYFFDSYNSKSMDKVQTEAILDQIFGNPSEFTLVIAGDYHEEELKRCLEKYLASIPSSRNSYPKPVFEEFSFPEGVHHRLLDRAGIGHEAQIVLAYPIKPSGFKESYDDFYTIELAKDIINRRLLKKLRSETGETYNISARVSYPFHPKITSAAFIISFTTLPDAVDKMTTLLLEEMKKVVLTPPTAEEIEKAVEIHKHQMVKKLQDNKGKIDKIFENLAFGVEPTYYVSERCKKVSLLKLHEAMKNLIDMERYTLHTKMPNTASSQ